MKSPFTKSHIISTLAFIALILISGIITKQASAASLSLDKQFIDIGRIQQGTPFEFTVTGGSFHASASVQVPANMSIGTAAINAHCGYNETDPSKRCPNITFENATLTDVVSDLQRDLAINNTPLYASIHGVWDKLKAGYYRLDIDGFIDPYGTATISGNWNIVEPAAVPLPPSVLLFGASLLGLLKLNRKK
jgi:hypothetical protein